MNKESRLRAMSLLKDGATNKEIAERFQITSSAAAYLRKKASGETPQMTEFIERIGFYSMERISRLYRQGVSLKDLCFDYEVNKGLMEDFIRVHGLRGPSAVRIAIPKKKTRTRK